MIALQKDIDDLDRMVDAGASKDAVRSQIRLIAREVATLEADYSSLAQTHQTLYAAHRKLQAQHGYTPPPPEQETDEDRRYNEIMRGMNAGG